MNNLFCEVQQTLSPLPSPHIYFDVYHTCILKAHIMCYKQTRYKVGDANYS